MTTDTAVTILTWILAAVAAAAIVLLFVVRSWLVRAVVLGAAALLLLASWAVRTQISNIAVDSPGTLCAGGVSWLGLELTGTDELCLPYR